MSSFRQRVIKNSTAYTLVNILPFVTGFITLPIYTRYMTPNDYGLLSLVSSFQAVLTTMVSLQLGSALPRYFFEYKGKELKIFFSTTIYSIALIALFFLFIIHLNGNYLVHLIFPRSQIAYFPYFFISLVTIFFSQLSQVAQLLLVVQEKGGIILYRSIIATILGVALGIYFVVYLKMAALGSLLAGAVGGFFMLLLNLWLVKDFFILAWRKVYFIQSLKYGLPIVPHAMGGFLFMYSDRVVMEKFLPLSAIGIYSIADRFSMLLKNLVNSINNALSPNFTKIAVDNENKAVQIWKKLITKWAVLISLVYLALALFLEEVIIILLPAKYHTAYLIVPILLGAYIFRGLYCFASAPLFFRKQTKFIPLITLTAGLFNVVANILLIPIFGLYGAALTTLLSFMVTFVFAEYFSRKCFTMQYEWSKLIQIFLVMFLIVTIVFFIRQYHPVIKFSIKLIAYIIFIVFLWIRNFGDFRNELSNLINTARLVLFKKFRST
jgi:O-antigen/teichoic acid export membrane protein